MEAPLTAGIVLAPPQEERVTAKLFDMCLGMSPSGIPDDAVNIAMQMIIGEARLRGVEPPDAVVGFAKGIGSVMAMTGLQDFDALWPLIEKAARDYFGRSRVALGRMGTGGSA